MRRNWYTTTGLALVIASLVLAGCSSADAAKENEKGKIEKVERVEKEKEKVEKETAKEKEKVEKETEKEGKVKP